MSAIDDYKEKEKYVKYLQENKDVFLNMDKWRIEKAKLSSSNGCLGIAIIWQCSATNDAILLTEAIQNIIKNNFTNLVESAIASTKGMLNQLKQAAEDEAIAFLNGE